MQPQRCIALLVRATILCLLIWLTLSACQQENLFATPVNIDLTPSATVTPTVIRTSTPTVQTPTASPTETFTPSPTLHPMAIDAMRLTVYPGSPIEIEQTLSSGKNYSRYYASYQSEGLTIYGLLTVPTGTPPENGFPAIVFNHGYIPPETYHTTERYVDYVDALAQAGYVVYKIDYRGHDKSEGEANGAYGDPGYTIDVLNAVASLKQDSRVDPNRIGMWGHSMGGYLTLRAMVISPDIRVGVIWGGVVVSYPDLIQLWQTTSSSSDATPTPDPSRTPWRLDWVDEFGSPTQNPNFWNSISANNYLSTLSGPIQLHHGLADEEVPPEFSRILADEVIEAGGYAELYTYEGDNHNISNSFDLAMERTISFFDQYLKNTP